MAFICNLQFHWFSIRKVRGRWYNLDSSLWKPSELSELHVSMFLEQLKVEGYSILVVVGAFPPVAHAEEVTSSEPGPEFFDDLDVALALSFVCDNGTVVSKGIEILTN
jgi:hypothetical protein